MSSSTHPVYIHFGPSIEGHPEMKNRIRSALRRSSGPRADAEPDVPTWIVVRDEIEGASTFIVHHTSSQFTLTAPSVDDLCARIEAAMSNDSRFDKTSFRLDGRPDNRPDYGPGERSQGERPDPN